jgi:hypothetical protein
MRAMQPSVAPESETGLNTAQAATMEGPRPMQVGQVRGYVPYPQTVASVPGCIDGDGRADVVSLRSVRRSAACAWACVCQRGHRIRSCAKTPFCPSPERIPRRLGYHRGPPPGAGDVRESIVDRFDLRNNVGRRSTSRETRPRPVSTSTSIIRCGPAPGLSRCSVRCRRQLQR